MGNVNYKSTLIDLILHPFRIENIIAVYIALKPLYIFPSGLPQISDILLLLFFVYYLLIYSKGQVKVDYIVLRPFLCLAGIFLYQLMVNLIWSVMLGRNLVSVNLFYCFNVIAFMFYCIIASETGSDIIEESVINGCVLSCAISLAGLVISSSSSVRSTSFFNNPNQLGYHSVLMISLLFLCLDKSNKIKTMFISAGSIWLIIASASKAALIGVFCLITLYLVFGNTQGDFRTKVLQLLLLSIFFILVYVLFFSDASNIATNAQVTFMRHRIMNMSFENDSDLASGRGYNRILEMKHWFFFGMGEGAFDRFVTMRGMEVHSTYASIIVSYGLIGAIGYLYFIGKLLFSRYFWITWNNLIIMSGLMLYSVSHNGIRNTLMWILFAILYMNKTQNTMSIHNNYEGI